MKRTGRMTDMRTMKWDWQKASERERRAELSELRRAVRPLKLKALKATDRQCAHLLKLWRAHRLEDAVDYCRRKSLDLSTCICRALTNEE